MVALRLGNSPATRASGSVLRAVRLRSWWLALSAFDFSFTSHAAVLQDLARESDDPLADAFAADRNALAADFGRARAELRIDLGRNA